MKNLTTPQPVTLTEPTAGELSAAGHWAETQVIQSIKDAIVNREDPVRALRGQIQPSRGGFFHPVRTDRVGFVRTRLGMRRKLRTLLGYLRS